MADSEITVTVKYGKGYEEPWVVFKGQRHAVMSDVEAFFALDTEGLTDHEVVVNAVKCAQGTGAIATKLGGTAISSSGASASVTGTDPWAGVNDKDTSAQGVWRQMDGNGVTAEADPNKWIYEAIDNALAVGALQKLWAQNQAAFDADSKLMDAYKAKGKSLTAKAA